MSMLGAMMMSGMAGGGAGSLGTLFVQLTANSSQLVRGMQQAEMSVTGGAGRMLKVAGGLAAGMAASFGVIGVAAVREFAKFDKAMTESTAIMGNMSAETRKKMEQTARDLARTTTVSAEQAARSYFYLASAGLNAEQSIAALPLVQKFAAAGAFEMALATDLLTDAQSALGLTVKDTAQNMENMTRVGDVLVKANTLANATVEQFSKALTSEAGAALKSFNIDVEEGVAVLAAFADQGVKAEVGGSGLSRVIRLVTSSAVNNKEAFEKYNVAVFDTEGNIRNLADIIGDLERALIPMSDEQRVATLEMLGFQARVQGVIMPLLGASQKIRDYEKSLRDAGNTIQDVSDKQLQSFSNQLKLTTNRFTELLLMLGESLVPVLRELNDILKEALDTNSALGKSVKAFTDDLGPALVTTLDMIRLGLHSWKMATLTLQALSIGFAEAVLRVWRMLAGGLATVVNFIVNNTIGAINKAIELLNKLIDSLPEWITGPAGIGSVATMDFKLDVDTAGLDLLVDAMSLARKEIEEDLAETAADALGFTKRTVENVNKIQEASKPRKSWAFPGWFGDEGALDMTGAAELAAAKAALSKEFDDMMDQQGVGEKGDISGGVVFNDPNVMAASRLQEERRTMESHLAELEKLGEKEGEITEETQARKQRAIEQYNENLKQIQFAQQQLILSSSSQIFGDLAYMTEQFAGKQSGAYKAMFAASKAFAIAEAIVKIQQGIAAAASAGWPMMIPAIAGVVAATANIVSTIQATRMEFAGERAMGGPVSGGKGYLVGERGPELFVPRSNGGIIPNDELGGRGVKVVINNYTDARPEVREREEGGEKIVEVLIQRVKTEIGSEIRDGRGALTKAMESTFHLRRGR